MQVDSSLGALMSCDNDKASGRGNRSFPFSSRLLLWHLCCIREETVDSNRKEEHHFYSLHAPCAFCSFFC